MNNFNIDEIEALVHLVSKSGVAEVSIQTDSRRIRVRKNRPIAAYAPAAAPPRANPSTALAIPPAAPDESTPNASLRWITAPMVGIYYHAEPPITVGSRIETGTIVGVIESMKLMNDVSAEAAGIVVEAAIEAGMAVEFGQPLFGLTDTGEE